MATSAMVTYNFALPRQQDEVAVDRESVKLGGHQGNRPGVILDGHHDALGAGEMRTDPASGGMDIGPEENFLKSRTGHYVS